MKSSKKSIYFALALSIVTGFGFSTYSEVAQAKPQRQHGRLQRSDNGPPAWTPAWGYRCKKVKNVERPGQRQCKKNELRRVEQTDEQKPQEIPDNTNTVPST